MEDEESRGSGLGWKGRQNPSHMKGIKSKGVKNYVVCVERADSNDSRNERHASRV